MADLKTFETGSSNFKEQMFTVAYNSFIGIFSKALTAVLDESSNSVSNFKKLQNILHKKN